MTSSSKKFSIGSIPSSIPRTSVGLTHVFARATAASLVRKIVVCGLSASLVLTSAIPVAFADTQTEVDAAAAQLETLGAEFETIQSSLQTKTQDLEKTSYEISQKEEQIAQTQTQLDAKKAELATHVRQSYIAGPVNMLSILLEATSFSDLTSKIYYATKVSDSESASIAEVKQLQDQLASEKGELEQKQASQQQAVADLQSQATEYQAKVQEAQDLYNSLNAQLQAELQARIEAQNAARAAAALAAVQQAAPVEPAVSSGGSESSAGSSNANNTANAGGNANNAGSSSNAGSSTTVNSGSGGSGSSGNAAGRVQGGGLNAAYAMIGVPYVWGGTSVNGVDCSGLICFVYGYKRGRTTYDMIDSLKASGDWKTSVSELQVGDLVFPHSGHVGIYIGNNQMIHAPYPGRSVCITNLYGFIGGGSY